MDKQQELEDLEHEAKKKALRQCAEATTGLTALYSAMAYVALDRGKVPGEIPTPPK